MDDLDFQEKLEQITRIARLQTLHDKWVEALNEDDFLTEDDKAFETVKFEQLAMQGMIVQI